MKIVLPRFIKNIFHRKPKKKLIALDTKQMFEVLDDIYIKGIEEHINRDISMKIDISKKRQL